MTLQRHWPEVIKMLLPVHYHPVDRSRWMDDEELRGRILNEWSKIGSYQQKGFIAELQSATCRLLYTTRLEPEVRSNAQERKPEISKNSS